MSNPHPDDGWRLPDDLWIQMEPFLPPPRPHRLGCHNPPTPPRQAMDAILFVLRTRCPWNALPFGSSSSAHRWFQRWHEAGVFLDFWRRGLLTYGKLQDIDWGWLNGSGRGYRFRRRALPAPRRPGLVG